MSLKSLRIDELLQIVTFDDESLLTGQRLVNELASHCELTIQCRLINGRNTTHKIDCMLYDAVFKIFGKFNFVSRCS